MLMSGSTHIAQLANAQRSPLTGRFTRLPRLRRVGRRLWSWGAWCQEAVVRPWQHVWNPRRPLGRLWGHLRLLSFAATFNMWKAGLALLAIAAAVLLFFGKSLGLPFGLSYSAKAPFARGALVNALLSALFSSAVLALLASLWNDLFRCPWLGVRIRRRIRKQPSSVLYAHLGARRVKLVPRQDPLKFAPRTDLFDEVLHGVLARDSKGVQIVVGEPGSGKTTALIQLAGVLAQIGVLPVLVPLRARQQVEDLVALAREQLKDQIEPFVRSAGEADLLWRWLCRRRRVAILVDDMDQISPDGERGYLLRRALEEAASRELPIVVTARPIGVPAGIAASSIELGRLDDAEAAECVEKGARDDPAFSSARAISRRRLEDWIREGELASAPFYLELLAHLVAGGRCPKLDTPDPHAADREHGGRYRRTPDGDYRWNPLWVRFSLLERFYEEAAGGRVRRWLGIEAGERHYSLVALKGAALGTLAATGIRARVALDYRDQSRAERELHEPRRERIEDFIGTQDRDLSDADGDQAQGPEGGEHALPVAAGEHAGQASPSEPKRRPRVSAHEVVDTGERLRILDCGPSGELQFRHRIMQAYLAGCHLAIIEYDRRDSRGDGLAAAQATSAEQATLDPKTCPDSKGRERDWIADLLDATHPEKLTAHMALVFAALSAQVESDAARARHEAKERGGRGRGAICAGSDEAAAKDWHRVAASIVKRLQDGAADSLRLGTAAQDAADAIVAMRCDSIVATAREYKARSSMSIALVLPGDMPSMDPRADLSAAIDPLEAPNPENRIDPDDALTKLTTAAKIAYALGLSFEEDRRCNETWLVEMVREAHFATRWTKLGAIKAIAQLNTAEKWTCIWEFARDADYLVRQAASSELEANACHAYKELCDHIDELILHAATRSALGMSLTQPEHPPQAREDLDRCDAASAAAGGGGHSAGGWTGEHVLKLKALAWILPAIVSGLREDPATHALEAWHGRDGRRLDGERPSRGLRAWHGHDERDFEEFPHYVNRAHAALGQLVALGFQGGQRGLEEALALGFKGDAMRHAHGGEELIAPRSPGDRYASGGPQSIAGPGWVASNRRLVIEICLERAESWYARLLLAQALALYTIAGAGREDALDALARLVHRGRERHPFAQRGARLARAAIYRRRLGPRRWHTFVWDDEGPVAGRRQIFLNRRAAQLVADVTVLLDLKEGSPDDRHEPFGAMRELPHCLSDSRDRAEILGKGCPDGCGWGFCPYKQPPPDEPSAHRGVTRAFCRQQQRIARWHSPRWQRAINRRRLRAFWREMEHRART
jgi:hypothetical protein